MAATSLNKSIFRLVVGTVLFTTVGVLISMWVTTSGHAQKQLNRNLTIAQGVLQQVLASREQQLYNSADVLTSDFGFKQAVATQDEGTIRSVLLNHGNRINADLMALISLDGLLTSSTSAALPIGSPFPYADFVQETINEGGSTTLMLFDDKLYQVIMLTVDAPRPIALTLVGFELEKELLTQLKNITQLDLSLQVRHNDSLIFSASTLALGTQLNVIEDEKRSFSWWDTAILKKHAYISKQFQLAELQDQSVWVVLSENAEHIFSEFNQLQITITLVALLSILITLLFGAMFARNLATPLKKLAEVAHRISHGNYQQTLHTNSEDLSEVQDLSSAFSLMQDNIRARESKIIFQANHDLLTRINNRYHIEKVIDDKLQLGESFQAIGINIFGFRGINDIFGYHSGDICLKVLASRVSALGGLAARLTGGELLWIPDVVQSNEQLLKLKLALEHPIEETGVIINLKVAIGIIDCPADAQTAQILFKRMNIVLDEAQITRQLLLSFDPEIEQRYLRRLSIIIELKQALAGNQQELSLAYQPKLNISANKIMSVEALIRWNSVKLGFVSPEDFIRIAEQAGFIENVTNWVINRAMDDGQLLLDAGIDVCIAINLSAHDVMNPELLPMVVSQLAERNLPRSLLSFEITESDVVKDPDKAIKHLTAFKDYGFTLAIDDFGTGYSSMAYLKNLPVDTLKVDKSFVLKLNTQVGDQNIVQTVLKLAKSFGMDVVAEGVENQETLAMLQRWDCEYAQGYHICKPIPVAALIEWYRSHINQNWLENT
ncbi:bifunctional diguanylate cyclase/phosphodiesterase [Paraglaciecola hydrolytica]|uniref:Diguanylate phosphodiesterase n=1 Tax=Paraglaciecola hydrolytica TaxID=1799789 RepID=A0A135ZYN9_9ALTE|nr:EAL domain-containing protein [Paraglaciecola hydrolytica]KXI28102.1 diguanylate phosphodiesterase [Paraglaciecola hydrolytica]